MSVINGSLSYFRGGRRGFFGDDKSTTTLPPGTYGNGTQVAQITVDSGGNITNLTDVNITGASPTGAAGGALTGTYPNPQLAVQTQALNMGGNQINNIAPGTAATDAVDLAQLQAYVPNRQIPQGFPVSSTSVANAGVVQYSSPGSGAITQSAGVITLTNSTSRTQLYSVVWSCYGVSAGNTVTLYMINTVNSGVLGSFDTSVTTQPQTHLIVCDIAVAASTSVSFQVQVYIANGGTWTISTTGQGGVNVQNQCVVSQMY